MTMKIKALKVRPTNNRLLFFIGLIGVAFSVMLENSIMWVLALVMALTGLFNAGTWASENGWLKLTANERLSRILTVFLCFAGLVITALVYSWIGLLD